MSADALADLKPNPRNPRQQFTAEQLEPFTASLKRFGDLGGIVLNLVTGQLVGGHKRIEVFRANPQVQIIKSEQPEDAQGTVAHGYVQVEGSRFAYREVRWSPETEAAANLAANRWGAEWDWQLVSETLQSIGDGELLALTGFPAHELENLLAADWTPEDKTALPAPPDHGHTVHVTTEIYALLQQVKGQLQQRDAEELTDGLVVESLCRHFLDARG